MLKCRLNIRIGCCARSGPSADLFAQGRAVALARMLESYAVEVGRIWFARFCRGVIFAALPSDASGVPSMFKG